jgi:hypothetical protein
MIFAHIAGLNEEGRTTLYNQAKTYAIIDLDEFTDKIVSDKNMSSMYDKCEYHLEKSKDLNISKLQQKQETEKYKDLERKMNAYWKTRIEKYLDTAVQLNSRPSIVIGYSSYFKNPKVSINVNTPLKFFQKVDLIQHAQHLIEMNLDNYREEIIEGVFPLEFLNHDTIIKKRESLIQQYKKNGYQLDTINNILNSIHIAGSTSLPSRLFYAAPDEFPKKIPLIEGRLIAYEEDWLAIVSTLTRNHPGITKGVTGGKPFIKELQDGAFEVLNKPLYLYLITNTKEFAPIVTKNKIYKYHCSKAVPYSNKLYMENTLEKLQDLNINIIPFKEIS